MARDTAVKAGLKSKGIEARSFAGHLLFEPWSVETGQGGDAPDRLSARLRALDRPVIGHIHDGALILDLRCLDRDEDLLGALSGA